MVNDRREKQWRIPSTSLLEATVPSDEVGSNSGCENRTGTEDNTSFQMVHTHTHTEAFTHKWLYAQRLRQILLHTKVFYTQTLCTQTEPQMTFLLLMLKDRATVQHQPYSTKKKTLYTQTCLHRRFSADAFRHRRLYTHTLYIQKRLHKRFYTQTFSYIQTLLHRDIFTQTQAISSWFYARLRTVDSQPRTPGRTTFGSPKSIHISHPKTGIKQIEINITGTPQDPRTSHNTD